VPNMVRMSDHADLLVHEALNAHLVGILAGALDQSGNARLAKMARDTIGYHTTPVQAAAIAREAHVRMLVLSHIVPPLPNALTRHAFMRGVADARGDGKTILGYDGLMITMPAGSETMTMSDLI
jgi:ribonuclease Z